MACFQRDQLYNNKRNCESILLFVLHQKNKNNSQTYHDFTARNSRNTLQLKILPEKITKETFMGKHVKGIMYFSFFFSVKIYCQTVQQQNARLSQLQIKMSSLKDSIFSEVRRVNYTGLCRNIVVENIPHALNVFF